MAICLNGGATMVKGYFKGELGGKKIRIVSRWNCNGT
jgi:hypothetical protein